MPTVAEVLRDRIGRAIACVDRVLLNGYVKHLQLPGGVVNVIRQQMGGPIPSPVMLGKRSTAFRAAVEQFAAARSPPSQTRLIKSELSRRGCHDSMELLCSINIQAPPVVDSIYSMRDNRGRTARPLHKR